MKQLYEVRVREKMGPDITVKKCPGCGSRNIKVTPGGLGLKVYCRLCNFEKTLPDNYQKKSKFYWANGAGEAVSRYKGGGHIMWSNKVNKEKLLGIGEFFTLGQEILGGLRKEEKMKRTERRYLNEKKKEVLDSA